MLTTIEKMLRLQDVPLLRDLPTDALAHLATLAQERWLEEAEPLWDRGDPADGVYFLVEGVVVIHDAKGAPDKAVTAGSDLGAGALTGAASRATRATALRPSLVLAIGRDELFEVLDEHPEAARALLTALGERLAGEARLLDVGSSAMQL